MTSSTMMTVSNRSILATMTVVAVAMMAMATRSTTHVLVSSFTLPSSSVLHHRSNTHTTSRTTALDQSSFYQSSGSDAAVNGGSDINGNSGYFPGFGRGFGAGMDMNMNMNMNMDPRMMNNNNMDPRMMNSNMDPRMMNSNMGPRMMMDEGFGPPPPYEPLQQQGAPGAPFNSYFDPMRGGGRFNNGPPPPPMNGGGGGAGYSYGGGMGMDPQSQKYFAGRNNNNGGGGGGGMYGNDLRQDGIRMGGGGAGPGELYGNRPPSPFAPSSRQRSAGDATRSYGNANNNVNGGNVNNSPRPGVYDAEIYRDEEYYDRIERLFPVLSRIQGVNWQGHIQYLAGDLQFAATKRNASGRRQVGIRYDLELDGSVFLTITLGGRRIEMRGQRDEGQQRGGGGSATRTIRLDPMNEQDPNFMILTELDPDTILINEVDRYTGKVVLTASLSIADEDEIIQVSHDMGDLEEMPIEGHQVWSLTRPGGRQRQQRGGRGGRLLSPASSSSSRRGGETPSRNSFTGIPQPVTSSQSYTGGSSSRQRGGGGGMGRLYPVLSKFAGVTWEGDCRQVPGDLEINGPGGMLRPQYGGSRYDIYEDGTVALTTFMRSPQENGRLQSIVMRGRRVSGPGSPIRLDMERGPNSMIITELAPHTLVMNEVNRETGRVLFTASLFLANNDNEVVQVSHQVSGRDPRMPVDLHQVWRLNPAREGYEERDEWRQRQEFKGPQQRDRSMDMRGGRSAWSSRADGGGYGGSRDSARYANGATNAGRRSINGLLTEPPMGGSSGRGRYDDIDPVRDDHLWLLNRSPEETRDRFRKKFDQWDASNRDVDIPPGPYGAPPELDPLVDVGSEIRQIFPVLSQITGIDWRGNCRYIIGDTKPDSIMLLKGGMDFDLTPDGQCTMTTTLEFDGGRTRRVRMRGFKESNSYSMRLYPMDDEEAVYTILTEISPDTILLNEVDSETDKVIYTASLSLSNDRKELVQVTHELGEGVRMPVEGHQVWRMKRDGGIYDKPPPKAKSWVPGSSSSMEDVFPVLNKIEGTGWQGTFRFINGDLERQTNFEATGKMWYDLNKNGTCVLTIVSSLTDGSSRYVQMRGDRGPGANGQIRLDPVDPDGTNYMVVTELPPDTVLLSEIDRFTGKLVSTASLSIYKDEIIQISHEMGNRTKLDGHQIARLRRSKDRSASRGTMSYLLNGEFDDGESYDYGGDSLMELFPVLNQIDGLNWQGTCRVVDGNMREQRTKAMLSGGMRYDLHRNGTCTMTSVLMHPDGRTHQIKLQGTRVGKSNKRSIRLDPISGDSPFYTVLTEVPPDTILLNEVDKATNKVIFTASVSIADQDELVQISKDVDADGRSEDGHKVWRLKRSPVLGRNIPRDPSYSSSSQQGRGDPRSRGQGFRPRTAEESFMGRDPYGGQPRPGGGGQARPSSGFDPSTVRPNQSYGTSPPFGKKPSDPNVMFQ